MHAGLSLGIDLAAPCPPFHRASCSVLGMVGEIGAVHELALVSRSKAKLMHSMRSADLLDKRETVLLGDVEVEPPLIIYMVEQLQMLVSM